MTDLNQLWETSKPVGTAPQSVVRQPQQQPNTPNTTPLDQAWDAAKPTNTGFGTTSNPQPAPDASSIPAHDPSWGEAFGAMVSPTKVWESGKKMAQDIVEGGSKAIHDIASDPVGSVTGAAKKGLKSIAMAPASVAMPFLSEDVQNKIKKVMGGWAPEGDPIVQNLIERYGSLDKLKKTMYEDPGGTWLDLATAFSGGEAAAARAGMSKTAQGLSIGARIDPITLLSRGIPELPGVAGRLSLENLASTTIPKTLGWRSGVGPEVVTEIKDLYRPDSPRGPIGRNEFNDAFHGDVTAKQVVDRAEQGVRNLRNDANLGYNLDKDQWVAAGGRLDMSVIDKAEQAVIQSLHTPGGASLLSKKQRKAFEKMQEVIQETRLRGPGSWTVEELDALKRNIAKINVPLGDRELLRVRTALSNSVKDNILANAQGTKYHDAMGRYQTAMGDLDEMKSALSLGKNASDHTVMSKLQSVLRNNAATQYGARGALVDLLEQEGQVSLRPWLLGMATNVDAPRGITGAIAAGGSGVGSAGLGYYAMGPAGLAIAPFAIAGDMASRSPRVAARTARTIGEFGDDMSSVFPMARYPLIETGHEDRERDKLTPQLPPRAPEPQRRAFGGHVKGKPAFARVTR